MIGGFTPANGVRPSAHRPERVSSVFGREDKRNENDRRDGERDRRGFRELAIEEGPERQIARLDSSSCQRSEVAGQLIADKDEPRGHQGRIGA